MKPGKLTAMRACCLIVFVSFTMGSLRADDSSDEYRTHTIRGRVTWLSDSLARLHGIKSVPESAHRVLAVETPQGELIPLIEDIRGRAFRRDERLRGVDMELRVRQYKGSPFVQVIKVYALKAGHKYEVDYWCEVCAIAMYELKPCDCCQGDIELRERRVDKP